jgi:hypothetical protein
MLKDFYAHGGEEGQDEQPEVDETDERRDAIESVCRQIEGKMYTAYVESGKRPAQVFACYMKAVREILIAGFVDLDDSLTYYAALSHHLSPLSKAVYARQHWIVFEHIAKKAKDETRKQLSSRKSARAPM